MLATGGSVNCEFRGSTSETTPEVFNKNQGFSKEDIPRFSGQSIAMTRTKSPTRTGQSIFFNIDRTTQSRSFISAPLPNTPKLT